MNLIKAIVATVFLVLTSMTVQAQVEYEHAIIQYDGILRKIYFSIDGHDYREVSIPKEQPKTPGNFNPALQEVRNMTKDGWELYDHTPWGSTLLFHLRRPRK